MEHNSIVDEIVSISTPLREERDLKPLLAQVKDKKIVMLGEASHGTQDFYEWRRRISLELIKNHGFNFIAVEGDWPSCQGINDFIQRRGTQDKLKVMNGFSRWPTWMWGNTSIMDLMEELREFNEGNLRQVGFHGMDVYSLYESMDEVVNKLQEIDFNLGRKARELYSCLEPYRHDEREYVRSLFRFPPGCKEEVVKVLSEILNARLEDGDKVLDVTQNARIVQNAENYYHTMISQDDDSWNVRDSHMMETLDTLINHYGPDSKAIIWAHNTHIGDYRATDMLIHGQVNIGGLAREKYGEKEVALIGFSTFVGDVVASHAWDGPIEVMRIPMARTTSLEFAFHQAIAQIGYETYYVDFKRVKEISSLNEYIGHRAIGVVYDPEHERRGNYVPTMPAKRYDGMIFCNETRALTPLNVKFNRDKIPETYPFGSRI